MAGKYQQDLSKGTLGAPDSRNMWQEIVAHISDSVLLKDNLRILNVGAGHGTEAAVLIERMRMLGKTDQEVDKSFYLIDKYYTLTNKLKRSFTNVFTGDFLETDLGKNFDIVIGNPPYQHPTNRSMKIWVDIALKGINLLKNDGYLLLVTPNNWLYRPRARGFSKITNAMKHKLKYVNMDASKHFHYIGEDIGYWILINSKDKQEFTIQDKDNSVHKLEAYNAEPFFETDKDKLVNKLKKEFAKCQTLRDVKIIDFWYSTKHALDNGLLAETHSSSFNTPVFISANRVCYTSPDKVTNKWKLILNKSGYYYSDKNPQKYMQVPDTVYYGVGENGVGIPASTYEEALRARSIYSAKIFRFYIDQEKRSGFNSGLLDLPVMDLTKDWSDHDLYSYFNLTQDEINLVEQTVKEQK